MDDLKRTAIIYDFDGTLARGNLQETSFNPDIGMTKEDFRRLAKLGRELMDAHLMRSAPGAGLAEYNYKGADRPDHRVEKVRYDSGQRRLWINDTTFFAPVPEEVWDFHIGGYQVLEKYLKDRKGRELSLDEIEHVTRIANVLAFTIAQMARIDEAWREIFLPDERKAS
jgi:hypothetical protein